MRFDAFCERLAAIETLSADTETTAAVADLFADAGDDLPAVARFVQGRVFPAWDATTLDVGPRLLYAALARAAGPNVTDDDVETRVAGTGDVGDVAAALDLGSQRGLGAFTDGDTAALTVEAVDETLRDLAAASGPGSESRKDDHLFGLFNRCSSTEARYLARLVRGEMRVGVGAGTVRDVITAAFDVEAATVERALQVSNDYGEVARVARDEATAGLAAMRLAVGRPIQPMLAQAGTAAEALDGWGTVGVETKFDGARVQLHYDGDETRAFSRNMADVTDALPELTEFADRGLDCPVILDGEVVAVDDEGAPLPFQEVLRRFRRKHDVDRAREDVVVELRLFDCLHADGDDLLDAPFETRHARLTSVVDRDDGDAPADGDVPDDSTPDDSTRGTPDDDPVRGRPDDDPARVGRGPVSTLTLASDHETIERHEARALAAGHEGIVLKNPEAAYTPGRRGKQWLKRKPAVDTLDLVVTSAEWGEGRRASFLGTFEVSVRLDDGTFAPVGKVATGITDDTLAELTERLEPAIESTSGKTVRIAPGLVLEVGYEEIQRSETYDVGYALRFPRLVAIREKPPDEADSLARVRRLAGDVDAVDSADGTQGGDDIDGSDEVREATGEPRTGRDTDG
nr:ATP-dependent DNA ligase [Salinigranum salinum]